MPQREDGGWDLDDSEVFTFLTPEEKEERRKKKKKEEEEKKRLEKK